MAQSNTNSGNAYVLEGLDYVSFAGAFIGQHNELVVGPSGNTAIANSGANVQGGGSQLNGTLQLAGAGASGGWAAATGLIALAFAGDATAGASNQSNSSNFQDVSSTLTTGNATAQNFTSVDATQSNDNSGNAGASEALAFVGIGVGAILQTNVADVTSYDNDAVANTGANAQVAGFQGNGTLQGAGAVAGSGWAGTLGGLAIAVAGDASAAAINERDERQREHRAERHDHRRCRRLEHPEHHARADQREHGLGSGSRALGLRRDRCWRHRPVQRVVRRLQLQRGRSPTAARTSKAPSVRGT